MRFNMFGEAYCHHAADIVSALEDREVLVDDDFYVEVYINEEDGETWEGEAMENESGDTVFYLEGFRSEKDIRDACRSAGISFENIQSR